MSAPERYLSQPPTPRRARSALGLHMGDHSQAKKATIVNDAGVARRRYQVRKGIIKSIFFPQYVHKDAHAEAEHARAKELRDQGIHPDEIKEQVTGGCRAKTVDFIHSKSVQSVLLLLLVLDVLIVITEIILLSHKECLVEVVHKHEHHHDHHTGHNTTIVCGHHNLTVHHGEYKVDHGCEFEVIMELPHKLHQAEKALGWISFAILAIFAVELFVLFFCLCLDFFTVPYVLDCVIVFTSIILFFTISEEDKSASALIIFIRCWRFARILHGFGLTLHDHDMEIIEELEKKEEKVEHDYEAKCEEVKRLEEEIERLSPTTKKERRETEPFANDSLATPTNGEQPAATNGTSEEEPRQEPV